MFCSTLSLFHSLVYSTLFKSIPSASQPANPYKHLHICIEIDSRREKRVQLFKVALPSSLSLLGMYWWVRFWVGYLIYQTQYVEVLSKLLIPITRMSCSHFLVQIAKEPVSLFRWSVNKTKWLKTKDEVLKQCRHSETNSSFSNV